MPLMLPYLLFALSPAFQSSQALKALGYGGSGAAALVPPLGTIQDPAAQPLAEPPQSRPHPFEGGLEALEPRGLRAREPEALDGYTLVAPLNSKQIHLVDMAGVPVHTWKTTHVPAGGTYLLDNGHLLATRQEPNNPRFHGGGIGGRIQEFDWDGKLVWDYVLATDQLTLHHDIKLLPNGNVLAIAWEYHSPDEALAAGRDLHAIVEAGLWSDTVVEIEPTRPSGGKIVWQWRSWDHLVQDRQPKKANHAAIGERPGRIDINADHRYEPREDSDEERRKREEEQAKMRALGYVGGTPPPDATAGAPKDGKPKSKYESDWLHTNGIDYHAGLDLIVLSTPHLGEIWVIDHGTTTAQAATSNGGRHGKGGDLLYRWGNPRNYEHGEAADQKLYYQHNPRWLADSANGAPRVLLFNNGMRRPDGDYSQVFELELPYDAKLGVQCDPAWACPPAAPAWNYEDRALFFSPFISGAQRLSNGNTLICSGAAGRVFEVTAAGKVVWDWRNTLGGEEKPTEQGGKAPPKALFRAERFAKNHPALRGLR
jgi:hypothetical protein